MSMKGKHFRRRSGDKKRGVTVVGTVIGSGRGFAFLSREGQDDLFIPARDLGGALHGDRVEAEAYFDHCEVRRILKFGFYELTGVFYEDMRVKRVTPDDRHFSGDIRVTGGEKAKTGDRVVVRLSRKDRGRGEIVCNLGKAGERDSDIAAVVYSLGIEDFKRKALYEAEQNAVSPISLEGRTDFTAQPCFTIDGEGSKDFDDAVYAERNGDSFRLWVHIADVAHYVPLNGHLDKEALRRGNSFYYGEGVIPMLPEILSNGVCSLNENEPRLTLSAVMDIDDDGNITGGEVCEGVICSHKRMTYEKVEKALNGETDEYAPYMGTLSTLLGLRNVLKKKRDAEGNIDFEIYEPKFTFEGDKVVDMRRAPRLVAHSIIEECMIAANRFIAKKFFELSTPFVYREHKAPDPEKIESLNVFLSALGENTTGGTSGEIAALLNNISPEKKSAVSKMTLRCMQKATYSVVCGGHFGLALKEYCHFTSPIRRYSDLTIHRVIKDWLHGEDLSKYRSVVSTAASAATEREKVCERAERKIDDIYAASFMSSFVGKAFEGVVSGVAEWGIYVELENTAEGMIRAETIGQCSFDESTMTMHVYGKGDFRLGDAVKVRLVSAGGGNIVFELD